MNQFVILTDISTQQILNHTELQFHSSTLNRLISHSFSAIYTQNRNTQKLNLNESREEQYYKILI